MTKKNTYKKSPPALLRKRNGTNEALWSSWPLVGCWINPSWVRYQAAMILVVRQASKGFVYAVFYTSQSGGGSSEEAIRYAKDVAIIWSITPGALKWLEEKIEIL